MNVRFGLPLASRRLALAGSVLSVAFLVGRAPARAQDAKDSKEATGDDKVDEARAKKALKSAAKIERQVERLRQLKYQVPVRKGMESEAALKRHLLEEVTKPENAAELEKTSKVAKAFGYIPRDFNLAREEADLLAEQIAGFYDNEGKKLRLVEKKDGFMGMDRAQMEQMDELTMAHELEHALQDQTFDLGRWFALVDGHQDRTEAWKCVVEGEATYVSFVWMFDKQAPGMQVPDLKSLFEMNKSMSDMMPGAKAQMEKMDRLPAYVVKNLTMPYEDGALFVQKVYDKGGWDAVSKLFRDPPSSTQQVLHPKKFFDRVEPAEINMPAMAKAAGAKAKELDRSTLGEFNVRLLLQALGVKEKASKKLAAGWHGDHYQAIEVEGTLALVWLSTWEDEDHAVAFEKAYRDGLTAKLHADGEGFSLERKGTEVLLVDCADAKLREKLGRKAWASAIEDGHLRPLQGFFEKPLAKDFTDADENSGFGGTSSSGASKVALGERVKDEDVGFSVRLPAAWKKQDKETIHAIAPFSRGLWRNDSGAELRILDLPMPFDKDNLPQQFEALVRKGAKDYKRGEVKARTIAGHEALDIPFEGTIPDTKVGKAEARAIAVERETMTLLFLVAAPAGKLEPELAGVDAALGTLEITPPTIKGERMASVGKDGRVAVGPGFVAMDVEKPTLVRLVSKDTNASIQVVATKALETSLDVDARQTEAMRAQSLPGYRSIGTSRLETEALGAAILSDYELKTDAGPRRVRELVAIRGGQRFTLTCACSAETYERNRAAFDRAIATFSPGAGAPDSDRPARPRGGDDKPSEERRPEEKKKGEDGPF